MTVQGPSLPPVTATTAPLQQGLVSGLSVIAPLLQGQVGGLSVYQATLPTGAIQAGNFTVAASGGVDVGGFQSSVQIGPPIQIETNLSGILFPCNQSVTVNWTGGDPNAWVIMSQVMYQGVRQLYTSWEARVSDGTLTIPPIRAPGEWRWLRHGCAVRSGRAGHARPIGDPGVPGTRPVPGGTAPVEVHLPLRSVQELAHLRDKKTKAADTLRRPRPSKKPNRLFRFRFFLLLAAFARGFKPFFLALGAISRAFDQLGTHQLQHGLLGTIAFART